MYTNTHYKGYNSLNSSPRYLEQMGLDALSHSQVGLMTSWAGTASGVGVPDKALSSNSLLRMALLISEISEFLDTHFKVEPGRK